MTPSQIQAARTLVASPHFRWMPGMRTSTGLLVARVDARGVALTTAGFALTATDLPDLTDPATLGCLLALAREAFGDGGLHVTLRSVSPPWRCMTGAGKPVGTWRATEGEANAAAILAAPVKP